MIKFDMTLTSAGLETGITIHPKCEDLNEAAVFLKVMLNTVPRFVVENIEKE